MPDTVVGLFRTRSGAEEALGKLKEAGFGQDQLSVSTPAVRRRGRYGLKVGSGIVIGTLVGALAGAVVTGMVPGVHPLIAGNVLATFLFAAVAGAATGGVAGGLLSMAASGDRAAFDDYSTARVRLESQGQAGSWSASQARGWTRRAPSWLRRERWKPRRSRRRWKQTPGGRARKAVSRAWSVVRFGAADVLLNVFAFATRREVTQGHDPLEPAVIHDDDPLHVA